MSKVICVEKGTLGARMLSVWIFSHYSIIFGDMKSFLPIIFLVFIQLISHGQDLLITKDADTIQCTILNVENELLFFKVESRDKSSQVPLSALHKYRKDGEWEFLSQLNPKVYESKLDLTAHKDGTIKQGGFYLKKGGKQLVTGGVLSLTGIAFSGVGGAVLTKNQTAGYALIGIGGTAGLMGLIYLVSAGSNIKKAGDELEFIPVKQ
jgi:hypothetical protein